MIYIIINFKKELESLTSINNNFKKCGKKYVLHASYLNWLYSKQIVQNYITLPPSMAYCPMLQILL